MTWQGLGTAYLNRRLYFKAVQAFQKAQEFQREVSIEQMVSCLRVCPPPIAVNADTTKAEVVLLEAPGQRNWSEAPDVGPSAKRAPVDRHRKPLSMATPASGVGCRASPCAGDLRTRRDTPREIVPDESRSDVLLVLQSRDDTPGAETL